MLLLLLPVLADLPVHCLRHHVEGAWRLHLGPLAPERTSCGHEMPDVEAKQPNRVEFQKSTNSTFEVLLSSPNVAHPVHDGKQGAAGTWTMVYDEGFFLEADDKQFFAFSHFQLSDPESVKNYFPTRVHGKKVYRSMCGQTEVGWYQDQKSGHWGCFVGERSDMAHPDQAHDFLSFLHVPEDPTYHVPRTLEDHERTAAELNEALTKQGLAWEAGAYESFVGLSVADLNRRAGPAAYSQTRVGREKSFMSVVRRTEPEAKEAAKDTSFRSKFPKSVDWRSVNGTNWLTPVTDQGDCGSCYVVSSMNMLSAKKRIHAKDHSMPALSISLPLYCSDLNQGCQGGYPFLTSLWGASTGLVDADCMDRYHVVDGEQCPAFLSAEAKKAKKPVDQCMKGKEHKVESFGYIGGYYGGCNEEGMMEALQHGPITIAVEPGMDFMYYRKGIYSSVQKGPVSPVAEEWVKVDHAVLMVGYGSEVVDGVEKPYWILQNSWGPDWGEDGYMRIARGENESGVEFQAVQASVTGSDGLPIHAFLKMER